MLATSPTPLDDQDYRALLRTLRQAYRESPLTPAQIAERAGVSENTVYRVIKGGRDVRISTLVDVAAALGHRIRLARVERAPRPTDGGASGIA